MSIDALGKLHGVLSTTGASFVPDGVSGNALSLTRSERGYVIFGDVLPLLNQAFSISAWIRVPNGDISVQSAVIAKHNPGTSNGYGLTLNQVGSYGLPRKASAFVASTVAYPIAPTAINDAQWHHLVMAYAPDDSLRLFVDGSPSEASSTAWPGIPSPSRLIIGGLDSAGTLTGTFNGLIDDVQIYDAALTDLEVDTLRANPGVALGSPTLPPLQVHPPGGYFTNSVTVPMVTSVPLGEIRYTIDGTEPTTDSPRYTLSLQFFARTLLKARVFVNGFPVSEVESAEYLPDLGVRIEPTGGLFTNSVEVTMATRLPAAVVRYTTDGADPLATSMLYSEPVRFTAAATVKARAFLNNFPVSDVLRAGLRRVYALDDGIPPEWREKYFGPDYATDPRAAADADPDSDTSSNLQEYTVDTHPLDPLSGFAVGVRALPEIRFASVPGQKYRILRRVRVDGPSRVVIDNLTATTSDIRYVDASIVDPAGFYIVEPVQ